MRDQFRSHPYAERTERFVELYDNRAFDAKTEFMPLSEFAPVVRRVLTDVRESIYLPAHK